MTQLSQHFSLAELTASETAARRGFNNDPPIEALNNLYRVAWLLEVIRSKLGKPIIVSSGYRSGALNAAVGSKVTSAHVKGLAADIRCPGMTPKELALAICDMGLSVDQIILEFADHGGGWVHVGISNNVIMRNERLTINSTGTFKGIC